MRILSHPGHGGLGVSSEGSWTSCVLTSRSPVINLLNLQFSTIICGNSDLGVNS